MQKIGIDWLTITDVIAAATKCMRDAKYEQPLKTYLRYKDRRNRIIAMPAYLGGEFNVSGIKWISSFPNNVNRGIPRAHCVLILNDADTGVPIGSINSPLISIYRTAAVSGLVIRKYMEARRLDKINIGIVGWGPIGKNHLKMCVNLLSGRINKISLFDLRPINLEEESLDEEIKTKVFVCDSWQSAYLDTDIFITCTVSEKRYIDLPPKKPSLHLNVSLRDYLPSLVKDFEGGIIVDDWDEVCRESTDIEFMHKQFGLERNDTKNIVDVVCDEFFKQLPYDQTIFFNPMGMAIFDIAVGYKYLNAAMEMDIGFNYNSAHSIRHTIG